VDVNSWIGESRAAWQYPIKTMFDLGTSVCFGSDWPVSDFEPLRGIHVAVNHRLKREDPVFNPNEKVDLSRAIYAYTLGAAKACLRDNSGSVEVGKAADLIVVDRNLFKIDPEDINQACITTTIADGKILFTK